MSAWHPIAAIALVLCGLGLATAGWDRPPLESTQLGYRGLGMEQITNLRRFLADPSVDQLPAPIPPVQPGGPMATETFKNVKVLTDLSSAEFVRLMTAMTAWVSPKEGCNYCHDGADLASDAKYTKVVSRRMIEMVRHINSDWKDHVPHASVTCYTCHRGNPVPLNIWYSEPGGETITGQNRPAALVGSTSLPSDPFSTFFVKQPGDIRIVGDTALPEGNRASIKQTEYTYGLMMSISEGLGVNCTFCHNSRSFFAWDQSTPQRLLAWHGIQMVRNLNVNYIEPLKSVFPANRLGPHGQVPQVACATCHQGANKPLLGANLAETFPELQRASSMSGAEPSGAEPSGDSATPAPQ